VKKLCKFFWFSLSLFHISCSHCKNNWDYFKIHLEKSYFRVKSGWHQLLSCSCVVQATMAHFQHVHIPFVTTAVTQCRMKPFCWVAFLPFCLFDNTCQWWRPCVKKAWSSALYFKKPVVYYSFSGHPITDKLQSGHPDQFQALFTLFPEYFSPFPHGTFLLSDSQQLCSFAWSISCFSSCTFKQLYFPTVAPFIVGTLLSFDPYTGLSPSLVHRSRWLKAMFLYIV